MSETLRRKPVSTADAARETGISEYALRMGWKQGIYPAILIGPNDRGGRLRWDLDLLNEAIRNQMISQLNEQQKAMI